MLPRALRGVSIAVVLACSGCGSSSSKPEDASPNTSSNPAELSGTDYTYRLTEEASDLPLFTTPATHRLSVDDRAPVSKKSGLNLSAAKREFEPVQLVLGPGRGSVIVRVRPFDSLGAGQRITVARAAFVDGPRTSMRSWP